MKYCYMVFSSLLVLNMMAIPDPTLQEKIHLVTQHVQTNQTSWFGPGSILSFRLHSPSTQVQSILSSLVADAEAKVEAEVAGELSTIQVPRVAGDMVGALEVAQAVENVLRDNPSSKARVMRFIIGILQAGGGVVDACVRFSYTRDPDATTSQNVSAAVTAAAPDFALISGGLYNIFLGVTNWDAKAKLKDAHATAKHIENHHLLHGPEGFLKRIL